MPKPRWGWQTTRHAAGWRGITTWPWLMQAMQFQLRERVLHAQEHPLLSAADVVELLRHHLPTAAVTPEEIMAQLLRRHRKRKSSIDSASGQQRPSR